mgnify:CR=1 FL=1
MLETIVTRVLGLIKHHKKEFAEMKIEDTGGNFGYSQVESGLKTENQLNPIEALPLFPELLYNY